MIVVEFAAEGHNDALMIVFVLLGMLLAVGAHPGGSLVGLMLAALAKYLPLVLLPAHLAYFWRTRQSWVWLALHLTLGLAAGMGLAALLYSPVWAGVEIFRGVRESGRPSFLASTPVILLTLLQRSPFAAEAPDLTSRLLCGIFALYVLIASARVRDAAGLLKACAGVSLVYLLVASPGYWPWYASMPLALMALTPHGIFRWMIFVLTFCSRLVAPIDDMAVNGFANWPIEVWSTTAIALVLPLLVLLLLVGWQLWRWIGTGGHASDDEGRPAVMA